ncbi:MAG: SIS domain-containing protein [Armatimonadetes bacterium]|nr:MAG: SIS domain-containing protein [Armatimonadota bacterium]
MSRMLEEIEEQPALWTQREPILLEQAGRIERPSFVVFAARGSSDHACLYARYLFEAHLQIPCSLSAPSVITRYGGSPRYPEGALILGVSQSAAAPDVAAVLEEARRQGCATVSLTNREEGPVVSAAERQIFLGAGEERAVAATKTFTLTLLAFYQLARAWGADLPSPPTEWDLPTQGDVEPFAKAVAEAGLVFTLGRGYHFSIALEAALKLMECALLPAKPYSIADFAHGPIALVGEGTVALAFGSDAQDETAEDVRQRVVEAGGSLLQAPVVSSLPEELRVLPAAVFAQRLAWQVARARGLDPDHPRNLSKVTRTR